MRKIQKYGDSIDFLDDSPICEPTRRFLRPERNKVILEAGMVLHFDPLEWHVFEFEADGYVDIIFFYGQVTNIRPEEMLKNR
jgi:hypothetical protein